MCTRLLVAVLALAACDSAGAKFVIDTSADPTIDEVRVYVGKGHGTYATIGSPQVPRDNLGEGTYWKREGTYESLRVAGGQTEIEIDFVGGGKAGPLSVIAVGLSNGIPTSVAMQLEVRVPTDVVSVWTLALARAQAASASDVDVEMPRVDLWGEEPGDQTCVRVLNASTEHPHVLIVNGSHDKDCDGFRADTSQECDDTWWRAEGVAPALHRDCLVAQSFPSTNGPDTPGCLFGAATCRDGDDNGDRSCNTKPAACAPLSVCEACDDSDPQAAFACALGVANDPSFQGALTCQLDYIRSSGELCAQRLRTPDGAPLGNLMQQCEGSPWFRGPDAVDSWTSSPRITGGTITVEPVMPMSCQYLFQVAPGPDPVDNTALRQTNLMSLKLVSGRYVIVPMVVQLAPVDTCEPVTSSERACRLELEDPSALVSCLIEGPL